MRTVVARTTWNSLFDTGRRDLFDENGGYSFYYRRRRLFTRALLFLAVMAGCLFFSLGSRALFVTFLSLGIFLYLLRENTKRTASGIYLKRVVPARAHEMDEIAVTYKIRDSQGRQITAPPGALIVDAFTGHRLKKIRAWPEKLEVKILCDGGMGHHVFGPREISVTDPLGIFEFAVIEDEAEPLFVYPRVENLPTMQLGGSRESLDYGVYEVNERGGSTNFMGVREYVPGDQIKQISWRLTAKHGRLLVKEFEKICNTEISILLDMEAKFHAGLQSDSTWEYARDISLGLVTQQTGLGNSMQILSQTGYIPWGRGPDHCHYVTRCMPGFIPQAVQRDLVDTYWEMIPRSSTVFYIGSVFPDGVSDTLKSLARLKFKDADVFCILLDGNSFLQRKIYGTLLNTFVTDTAQHVAAVGKFVKQLRLAGVKTVVIRRDQKVSAELLRLEAS